MISIQGKGVSSGVGVGPLYFYHRTKTEIPRYTVTDPDAEWHRFKGAQTAAIEQLGELAEKARAEAGDEAAMLFETHQMMAEDLDYEEAISDHINNEKMNAEAAISDTAVQFAAMFESMDDSYMQARAADVRDVSDRILGILSGAVQGGIASDVPVLLAADDLAPSETVQLDKSKILGFITAGGSGSSHTAILARTMGIPAIVGVGDALKPEYEGRSCIIDGATGNVVIDPDDMTRDYLLKKREEQLRLQRLLETLKGQPNVTKDGKSIRIYCNIGSPDDVHAVQVNDGGGIGLFVAYVGMLNVGLIKFTPGDPKAAAKGGAVAATPGLANFNDKVLWVFLIGLVLAIVFTVMKVKGGMLLAIAITTVIGIPFGVTTWSNSQSISETFSQLPQTFGAIFSAEGFPALFSDPTKLPLVIVTIFAFSMSDTFDTLGTFIGTGRRTGIFSAEDEKALENGHGFSSKMDKALFADSIATSIGAICGTSNTTTYVESSAGIAAGGRTGLTSVVVAICFALSAFLAPVVSAVPSAATAGVLVIVGCMMAASLKEVKWDDIAEAIPAFFAAVFMAFSYSISYGIAGGFIMYCIVKTCKGKAKEVHPIIWTVAALFILDFVCMAIL